MNDDFDKQDDDFDWLSDDDDESSVGDSSGLTGELSWLEDSDSSPDAKKTSKETDDLDLDWLSQGEDDGKPTKKPDEATGITGELSWLSDDMLADSPDAGGKKPDTSPFAQVDDEESTSEADDLVNEIPDWLQMPDDADETDDEVAEPDTSPQGLLDMFDDMSEDMDEDFDYGEQATAGSPGWLSSIGDTGALSDEDEEGQPAWLANIGDTGTLNRDAINQQLDSYNDDDDEGDSSPDWLTNMGIGQASDDDSGYESVDDAPDWLSGMNFGDEPEQTQETAPEAEFPDMDTLFGFSDSAEEADADTGDTDWLTQYDDETEFPLSQEPVAQVDDDEESEKVDTGWLEYEEEDVDEEYDPYAQYAEEFGDDEAYEDVLSEDTVIDTGILTSKSDLFDPEQPVSEPLDDDSTPDWLSAYDDDDFGEHAEPAQSASELDDDWLSEFDGETFATQDFDASKPDPLDDVPDWLKGDDSLATGEPVEDDPFAEIGDELERTPTGLTGELGAIDDELDFDLLDELDDEISRSSTGLTGELSNLDDIDFDLLGDIDIGDIDIDNFDLDELAGDLEDFADEPERVGTGFTGELAEADDEMDLSFLDEVEVDDDEPERVGTGFTGELAEADDEMDLSFLDEVEVSDSAPDRAATGLTGALEDADEELDLSFLDEPDEDDQPGWFDDSAEDEGEPAWMQTLDEVDELVEEAEETDFDAIFGEGEFEITDFEEDEIQQPAANLDTLLASFEDVDEGEFVEDASLSQIDDLDAIFDAALSDTDEDDVSEHIPEWLRDVDVSSDESSAAAIVRQRSDKPIEELDDRLQALRERGLSVASQSVDEPAVTASGVFSGVEETLSAPHIAHEAEELAIDVKLTSSQQKQAQLLRDIVGVTITPTLTTDEAGIPIVESSRRRRRALPNIGLGRLLVTVILLLVMILPFVTRFGVGTLPPQIFGADNRSANAVFNQIEALNEGDWVLVGFEYGPTAAGELDSVADILLRHIFSRGAKPIIVSSNPVAVVHAQNILGNINQSLRPSGMSISANQDYYIVRYLAGGTLGLRDLNQNLDSLLSADAQGKPTQLNLQTLDDLALMVLIAERSEDIRSWAEQIVPSTRTRLIAATGYAAQPLAEPYVSQSEGIVGLMVGYRDAYTYGEMLQSVFATATPEPTATLTLTFTASPIPTETHTPLPTDTPEPSNTPDDAEASGAGDGTVTVEEDETPATVEAIATTVQPSATAILQPTSTPTVQPSATATNSPEPSATVTPAPRLITVIVVNEAETSVNVRTGPGTNFSVVTTATGGDVFQVIGENDDGTWINFLLPDGREGWIADFLVQKTELPEAEIESDETGSAGEGVTVMRLEFNRRMGKNRVRYAQAPTGSETPTLTFTPTPTFTPSPSPTATLTPTPTPDPRANFVLSRDRKQENSRLNAMTLGTIAAVVIILFGNIFYGLRALLERRRESKR